MKRLPMNGKSVRRSWKRLGFKRHRLQVMNSLQMYCLNLELRHRRRLARRQVKKLMRLPRTTPYSKRYSIPIMKMLRYSVRRVSKLKARLSVQERNVLLTLRKRVLSLYRSTTTAHTPVVGQRPRVRGLIYKTSSGGRSYVNLSVHRRVTPSLYAISRRLSREFLRTSQTTNPYLKSLRRGRMRTQRLVRKCLVSPTSTKSTTPTSDSQLSQPYLVAGMEWVGLLSPHSYLQVF